MIRAAVAGVSGYVGGELVRLLATHPDVEVGALTANASAGSLLGEHHPQLPAVADREVLVTTPECLAGHDVVFLALPHGASAGLAKALADVPLVVDCGADHRLLDPADWSRGYPGQHAGSWPYGLPELPGARDALSEADRIAVPGCFPTAVALALIPATRQGLVDASDVVVVAATGTSGAGRSLRADLLASEVVGSAAAYGVGGRHRHVSEIEQVLRAGGATAPRVSFTPVLVPMARGILATVTAPLIVGVTAADVRAGYQQSIDPEPFWHLLPPDCWPTTKSVVGSNVAQVQVTVDERAGRLVAVCAIDNLTKGTAGGAIQSMNLALGLDEATGLPTTGLAP